jgi:hypothetical protein
LKPVTTLSRAVAEAELLRDGGGDGPDLGLDGQVLGHPAERELSVDFQQLGFSTSVGLLALELDVGVLLHVEPGRAHHGAVAVGHAAVERRRRARRGSQLPLPASKSIVALPTMLWGAPRMSVRSFLDWKVMFVWVSRTPK